MKINCTACLKNFEDIVLKDESKKDLTMGMALANMIVTQAPQGTYSLPWDNMKKSEVARKFYSQKEVELDGDDFQKLKELANKSVVYSPMVSGQVAEYLVALSDKEESKKDK